MSSSQESVFDVIVVGSGAGALTAAITARSSGRSVLLIEKTDKIGGTTSFSGGLFWVAANPLLAEAGLADSPDAALRYLDGLVGSADPPEFRARRRAYVGNGPQMVEFLRTLGLEIDFCDKYPDYYPDVPGASLTGRPLEPHPFDKRRLGSWAGHLRAQSLLPRRLKVRSSEFAKVSLARRSPSGFMSLAKVALRSTKAAVLGVPLVVGGEALVGQLLMIAVRLGVTIWLDSPFTGFVTSRDEVVGVIAGRPDHEVRVEARVGTILAAGGFARNEEMRARYARQPSACTWSRANPGETGEVLAAAMALGADAAHLNEAWYVPMSMMPSGPLIPHNTDRTKPHSIIVDSQGCRYVDEAANYNYIGQAMFARHEVVPAIPSWLVIDSNHRKHYPFFTAPPGRLPHEWLSSGYMKRAATLEALAELCGVDKAGLRDTVERFNAMADRGQDTDFRRGESLYDRYMGDPTVKPNGTLGALTRPPYYAVALYPGDLGTCGGLVTNEYAQVLRKDGEPISGLYAAGNITAPLAAGAYWGAGASIGASMTFGYIAGRSCAPAGCSSAADVIPRTYGP